MGYGRHYLDSGQGKAVAQLGISNWRMMVSFAVKIVKLESQSCSLIADQPEHLTSILRDS